VRGSWSAVRRRLERLTPAANAGCHACAGLVRTRCISERHADGERVHVNLLLVAPRAALVASDPDELGMPQQADPRPLSSALTSVSVKMRQDLR
jgi:hypothetical protein